MAEIRHLLPPADRPIQCRYDIIVAEFHQSFLLRALDKIKNRPLLLFGSPYNKYATFHILISALVEYYFFVQTWPFHTNFKLIRIQTIDSVGVPY